MANIVNAAVADRVITLGTDHDPLIAGNVGKDYVKATFDSEWDGLSIRATFACGKQVVGPVEYDVDEDDGVEIPHEALVPGQLRLSFVGVDSTGMEVLRTAHMRSGAPVKAAGADEGLAPSEKTMDIIQQAANVNATLSGTTLTVTDRTGTSVSANLKGDKGEPGTDADIAAAEAATSAANVAASSATSAASSATSAAASATSAATAATNAADSLAQRVAAGEFNGAAFSIKFTPSSIAAMNALTSMKKGDFACIQSNVDDEDNAKLYLYNGSAWNFVTDLSGATGIKGDKGVQGVSLKNVQVIDQTKVQVTQYDPDTKQDRTYVIGDFATPLATGIKSYVDSKFLVVDSMPASPVAGVVYMVRE